MKHKTALKKTDNPREYKLIKKKVDLKCPFCAPHKNENSSRRSKHGSRKPKYKNRKAQ